jgi:hypothetical protein
MGTVLDSLNNIIASYQNNGGWHRMYWYSTLSTNSATTACGYISAKALPRTITVPTPGGGLTGMYLTTCRLIPGVSFAGNVICALQYTLGTLTVSGNSFVAGVSMPTKSLRLSQASSSITTASQVALVAVTTTLNAATPVLTITYTNQDGDTGQTATLTLPTSPTVESAFIIDPHLASTDTGIRAVTNMSISTGSAGVLAVYGLLVLGIGQQSTNAGGAQGNPLAEPRPLWLCEAGETIGFYMFGGNSANGFMAMLHGVADT